MKVKLKVAVHIKLRVNVYVKVKSNEMKWTSVPVILDLPAQTGLKRGLSRDQETKTNNTRFENMKLSFHNRVRNGFKEIATSCPNRVHSLNAEKPIEEVTKDINDILSSAFNTELNIVWMLL